MRFTQADAIFTGALIRAENGKNYVVYFYFSNQYRIYSAVININGREVADRNHANKKEIAEIYTPFFGKKQVEELKYPG